MTLHDVKDLENLHFLSFLRVWLNAEKVAFFPRVLPMKTNLRARKDSNLRPTD